MTILPFVSRNVLIAVGAVIVVAVVGGLFAFTKMSKAPAAPSTSTSTSTNVAPEASQESITGSLKSLIGAGKNVTCSTVYTDGKGSGTVYVSDKKFRGEFDTTVDSKTFKSHMISDGTYSYIWTDDSKQGTKFNVEALEKVSASPAAGAQQGADLNANVDMKCSSWNVDNSKFTPPGDVTFSDMSSLMKNIPSADGTSAPKLDSSYCDAIEDAAAKAACLSAAGQ